jgi:hypothetical protein
MLGYGQFKAQSEFYQPNAPSKVARYIGNSLAEGPAPDMDSPAVKFANADVIPVLSSKQKKDISDRHKGWQKATVVTEVAKKKHRLAQRRFEKAMRSYASTPRITFQAPYGGF